MAPKKKDTPELARIKLEEKTLQLAAFFEQGFEAKDWLNVSEMDLPATLKYMGYDIFKGKYGETIRYKFETKDGEEARLLCKGATFQKAIDDYVVIGAILEVFKSDKNYWFFTFAKDQ